jgi:hypothetical protein
MLAPVIFAHCVGATSMLWSCGILVFIVVGCFVCCGAVTAVALCAVLSSGTTFVVCAEVQAAWCSAQVPHVLLT